MVQIPELGNHFIEILLLSPPLGGYHQDGAQLSRKAKMPWVTMGSPLGDAVPKGTQVSTLRARLCLLPQQAEFHPLRDNQEGSLC